MGCDIHVFVEHRHSPDHGWWNFGGEFHLNRDYRVFGWIADCGRGGPPIVPQRGIPTDLAWRTAEEWLCPIAYDGAGSDRSVSPEEAARFVVSGWSRYVGERRFGKEHAGKPSHVTDPDNHSPNWLTPDEWANVLCDDTSADYRALLAAMRALEESGDEVRVVYWFDN